MKPSQYFRIFFIFLVGTVSFLKSYSQNASVEISPNTLQKQFFVGDTIVLTLKIKVNKGDNISSLNIPSSKFELVDSIQSDTAALERSNYSLITTKIIVSAYDSGKFYFPQLKFILTSPKLRDPKEYITDSIPFKFEPIAIDVDKDFKPIKDIEEVEFSILDYIYYIIGGLIIIVVIILLVYYLKRKKPIQEEVEAPIIKRTPLEIATESFLELKNKNLPQEGRFKQFFTELTDIYRVYIHDKDGIDATEMTSAEILQILNKKLDNVDYKELKYNLELSDLVKFAKYTPLIQECDNAFEKMQGLVK